MWAKALGLVLLLLPMESAKAGPLTVQVAGVRAAGRIHVAVCEKRWFMKDDCPIVGSAPSNGEPVAISFAEIPAGRYAVMVYQDRNGDGHMDYAPLRLPKEPWGLSGPRTFAPTFERSAFDVGAAPVVVTVELRRPLAPFSGP